MLPLPERGKNWKQQKKFQRTRQFLALLTWGREPIHHVPHTGWTLYILKGSRDLRFCQRGFDNDTPVAAERRIPTVEREEGSSHKNEMHHTPIPVQSHFHADIQTWSRPARLLSELSAYLEESILFTELQLLFHSIKETTQCNHSQDCLAATLPKS